MDRNCSVRKCALVTVHGDEELLYNVARLSYGHETTDDTSPEEVSKLVKAIAKSGHHTILEFASMHFLVTAPVYTARQWMRHRHMSYNERSMRRVSMGINPDTGCIPASIPDSLHDVYKSALTAASRAYGILVVGGARKEDARAVLPMGSWTQFHVSANLRSWANFIQLRSSRHAQSDIRWYANRVAEEFARRFPSVFEGLAIEGLDFTEDEQ